eukprot:2543360-Alexandrium_andersonii.AAC.1
MQRGREHVRALLGKLRGKGYDAVRLQHPFRAVGQPTSLRQHHRRGRSLVAFSDIEAAFEYATHDCE